MNGNTLPLVGMNCKILSPRLFAPLGPRDCPRAISRALGCKLSQGAYFPIHPSSPQCIITCNTILYCQKECQYTASSREEFENMPPLGPWECPWASPSGNISGVQIASGAYFPIHPSFRQCINPVLISRKNSLAAHQALIQVLCTGIRSTTFSGVRYGIKFFPFFLFVMSKSLAKKSGVPSHTNSAVSHFNCKETFFWMTSL